MDHPRCGICSRDGTIPCNECGDYHFTDAHGFEVLNKRWYCSELCKLDNKGYHKFECDFKIRKGYKAVPELVHRAGNIAQELFYLYIEQTFVRDIHQARVIYGPYDKIRTIEILTGKGVKEGPGGISYNERRGGGWLVEFPPTMHQQSEGAKAAILANGNSVWAFVVMSEVVRYLFKDLVNDPMEDIKEVRHTLKHGIYSIVCYEDPHSDTSKRKDQPYNDGVAAVYEIDLKSGQKIALDLTGAQYQFHIKHMTVRPWLEYWHLYGKDLEQRDEFSTARDIHIDMMRSFDKLSHLTINMYILEGFDSWIKKEEEKDELLSSQHSNPLLTNDLPSALKLQHELLDRAKAALSGRLTDIDNNSTITPSPNNIPYPTSGLRHPRRMGTSVFVTHDRHMLTPHISPLRNFNWDLLRELILDKDVPYKEKKEAKDLLQCRAVYAPWGDSRIVFLSDTLPGKETKLEWVSENPHWKVRLGGGS